MAWVVSVLGAMLALGGGYALWTGSGYIRLDWGQAETVAGTVALSAGVVTIAIAAVLFALRDLARAAPRLAAPDAPSVALAPDAPALPARDRLSSLPADPSAAGAAAPLPARNLDESVPAPHAPDVALVAPPRPAPDAGPQPVAEAPRPAAPAPVEAPTVVGRYEANGASYVLFSDGTIEVETEGGTHRFASMGHLKDHIARQDAG